MTLTQAFYLGKYPVTQQQYPGITGKAAVKPAAPKVAIDQLTYAEAMAFCAVLTQAAGVAVTLPTEAQWECACRAGSTTPFFWGEQIDSLLVNFNSDTPNNDGRTREYREQTVEVKVLPCNDWGLHQMHGNVMEWCQDWSGAVSYTHLRAHETVLDLVCRLLLEKTKTHIPYKQCSTRQHENTIIKRQSKHNKCS